MSGMGRREFVALLGGAAAAWPLAARAQQPERMRRIGVLMGWSESDPQFRSWIDTFVEGLAQLGWGDGRNVQMIVRWASGDVRRMRTFAKELVELQPDVILGGTTPVTAALQRETRTIPIVFVVVADPVGAGFVAGLPHPGGNITGFLNAEAAIGGKWLEMLKEIAPHVTRVAIMFNPDTAPLGGAYFLGSFEAAAQSLGVEPITAHVRSDDEIEAMITSLGGGQSGLVIMTDSFMGVHRGTVISLAARTKVPVIGADLPSFAREGGLLSYGASLRDIFRRAAPYVDRILRGANPGDLPVQAPVKYEMIINLKTAKALGLEVPPTLLALADEVIE
jgi:putative tryptophan/tyrosine transport system substrate-binding protein